MVSPQRHDHEQLAALRQMVPLDGPFAAAVRTPQHRQPEAEHRRDVFAQYGDRPQRQADIAFRQPAGDPEDGGDAQPAENAVKVSFQRVAWRQQAQHRDGAPDLNGDIEQREDQTALAKRLRQRGGGEQPQQHDSEQQQADLTGVGIEPVGDPGGVLPGQPDGEPQQQGFQRAGQRQVMQQIVGKLGHGENVDQIEQQFGE